MNKNEKPSLLKGKGAAVGIVICFVAVIVMVGAYTFNNYNKKLNQQLAKAEEQTEQLTKEKSEATTTNDIIHQQKMTPKRMKARRTVPQEMRRQQEIPHKYISARRACSHGRQAAQY